MDQTIGPLAMLGDALCEVRGVTEAYVFGTWAARHAGEYGPTPRDLDVLIVGDADSFEVHRALDPLSRKTGVETNPYLVSEAGWDNPPADSFIAALKGQPLVPIQVRESVRG